MITHIHSTHIPVKDQDAAVDFYVNTLGFVVTMDNQVSPDMRWITVSAPGAQTNLALMSASCVGPVQEHTGIAFVSDDIDADYVKLTAAGVKFKSAPVLEPWGDKGVHFCDPDGNEFYLNGPAK